MQLDPSNRETINCMYMWVFYAMNRWIICKESESSPAATPYPSFTRRKPFRSLELLWVSNVWIDSKELSLLLRFLSVNGRIYYSAISDKEDSTVNLPKEILTKDLFYRLPAHIDDGSCYLVANDVGTYMREFYFLRSLYSRLLYERITPSIVATTVERAWRQSHAKNWSNLLQIWREIFPLFQSSPLLWFDPLMISRSSSNSTTHTCSSLSSSLKRTTTQQSFHYQPWFSPILFASSHRCHDPTLTISQEEHGH